MSETEKKEYLYMKRKIPGFLIPELFLRTKLIDKVSINDLTEHCDMSRMTFYYHFKNIYDSYSFCNSFSSSLGRKSTPLEESESGSSPK